MCIVHLEVLRCWVRVRVRVLLHCEQPKGYMNKRLLSWMGEQVFFEVISLCTWVAALCASKGFPSRVYEHVYLEAPSRCAEEVALFANNRLLSNVNWTTLSPFSISYLRKSHSQAGMTSTVSHWAVWEIKLRRNSPLLHLVWSPVIKRRKGAWIFSSLFWSHLSLV